MTSVHILLLMLVLVCCLNLAFHPRRRSYGFTAYTTDFAALQCPVPWPPPHLPDYPPHPLSWVPLLGWPFRYFRWLHYSNLHHQRVLEPIAVCIITQLEKRPTDGNWPIDPEQKILATIVSDAMAIEKGLERSRALHPEDPVPLLFWGIYDDCTPLIVRIEVHKKLKREIPGELILTAWNERWTIQRFIEECLRIEPRV